MKRLAVRFTPDPEVAPSAFLALADSPAIEEARLLEFNAGESAAPTALFDIDGPVDHLRTSLADDPAISNLDTMAVADDRGLALVTIRPERANLAGAMLDALVRSDLVIDRPVVYRNGTVRAELIGTSTSLQAALDSIPSSVETTVVSVDRFGRPAPTSRLSDRQREAVQAGLELGYYEVPRRVTQTEIAERLGCAPSTVGEHLQKAEAKLVTSVMPDEAR